MFGLELTVFVIRGKPRVFVVYYNGECESEREEMRWCRCYEGQTVED